MVYTSSAGTVTSGQCILVHCDKSDLYLCAGWGDFVLIYSLGAKVVSGKQADLHCNRVTYPSLNLFPA